MNVNKKITDFIKLEEGNIGRKAATVTGALLASTVLGAVLTSPVEAACHCNVCGGHVNYWYSTCNGSCWMHHNNPCEPHYNVSGGCPLPC
jgi:hypothetical protein